VQAIAVSLLNVNAVSLRQAGTPTGCWRG
jgi:hypothetical protein